MWVWVWVCGARGRGILTRGLLVFTARLQDNKTGDDAGKEESQKEEQDVGEEDEHEEERGSEQAEEEEGEGEEEEEEEEEDEIFISGELVGAGQPVEEGGEEGDMAKGAGVREAQGGTAFKRPKTGDDVHEAHGGTRGSGQQGDAGARGALAPLPLPSAHTSRLTLLPLTLPSSLKSPHEASTDTVAGASSGGCSGSSSKRRDSSSAHEDTAAKDARGSAACRAGMPPQVTPATSKKRPAMAMNALPSQVSCSAVVSCRVKLPRRIMRVTCVCHTGYPCPNAVRVCARASQACRPGALMYTHARVYAHMRTRTFVDRHGCMHASTHT
jgi:hypothetical protein